MIQFYSWNNLNLVLYDCANLVEAEKLDLSEAGTENYERVFVF